MSVILLIGLTYTFVLTGDYGAMDRFVFQKLSFADTTLRMQKYLYAFITLGISAFLTLILLRRLSIVFKIIFCKKTMDWGKTTHGITKLVENNTENTSLQEEQPV